MHAYGIWISPRLIHACLASDLDRLEPTMRLGRSTDGWHLLASCLTTAHADLVMAAEHASREQGLDIVRRRGATVWLVPRELVAISQLTDATRSPTPQRMAGILARLPTISGLGSWLKRLGPIVESRQMKLFGRP